MTYANDQERRDDVKPAQEMARTILHKPMGDAVFVLSFPKVNQVGQILLPNQSAITVYEGHVFAKGPAVTQDVGLGDCIIWAMHSETGLSIDELPKFSVIPVGQILASYRSKAASRWNQFGMPNKLFVEGPPDPCDLPPAKQYSLSSRPPRTLTSLESAMAEENPDNG